MKKLFCMAVVVCLAACGGSGTGVTSDVLTGSDETVQFTAPALQQQDRLNVDAPVNLRAQPSRDSALLMVLASDMEVTLQDTEPQNGFYKVAYYGREGWAYGAYLRPVKVEFGQNSSALTIDEINAVESRALGAMGYSYWWGGSAWGCSIAHGSCSGSCPSCTHSGSGGADCSGLVSHSWHVPPSASSSTCSNYHPYSSTMFYDQRDYWDQVTRNLTSIRKIDALVHPGHIFIRISGDPMGSMEVYECGGCASGCYHTYRTAASDYIVIRRRTGWL